MALLPFGSNEVNTVLLLFVCQFKKPSTPVKHTKLEDRTHLASTVSKQPIKATYFGKRYIKSMKTVYSCE